jgi:outer membrane protein W
MLLAVLAARPAAAQEGSFMVGVGASFAGEDFDDPDDGSRGSAGSFDVDDSRTWSAQLGYRASDQLAFELEYERFDDFEIETRTAPFLINGDGEVTGWSASLNTKIYPFEGSRLQPYVLTGVGYMEADTEFRVSSFFFPVAGQEVSFDDSGAVLQVGLGIDVQLTDNWYLSLEGAYKFPQSDLEGLEFYTLGGAVQFRF